MIVYNITIKVDSAIVDDWIRWQYEEHIPEIMATNLFTENKFFKLLEQEDSEGKTFVVQYNAATKEDYNNYIKNFAPALREKALQKGGDKFIAFRTILESVK